MTAGEFVHPPYTDGCHSCCAAVEDDGVASPAIHRAVDLSGRANQENNPLLAANKESRVEEAKGFVHYTLRGLQHCSVVSIVIILRLKE